MQKLYLIYLLCGYEIPFLTQSQKDEIFDAEAHAEGLASWARQHQQQQFVIGSLNPQQEQGALAPLSLEEGRARRRRNEETNE